MVPFWCRNRLKPLLKLPAPTGTYICADQDLADTQFCWHLRTLGWQAKGPSKWVCSNSYTVAGSLVGVATVHLVFLLVVAVVAVIILMAASWWVIKAHESLIVLKSMGRRPVVHLPVSSSCWAGGSYLALLGSLISLIFFLGYKRFS